MTNNDHHKEAYIVTRMTFIYGINNDKTMPSFNDLWHGAKTSSLHGP